MKSLKGVLAILALLLSSSTAALGQTLEEGWMGILPLVSTRDDIEKKLGKPEIDENGYHGFVHDGTFIQVDYAVGPCQPDRRGRGSLNVPKDTVLGYHVRFKREFKLGDLNWSKDRYQKQVDPHAWNQVDYVDYDAGISFKVGLRDDGEYVARITFNPSQALRKKYQCPDLEKGNQSDLVDRNAQKAWNEIKVLETSKALVEKRFGHPISTAYDRHVYENEAFRMAVAYADGPCTSPDSLLGGFNVEKDTVIEFDVQPKMPITLASLGWDMSAFAYKPELHRAQFVTYTDRSRGIHLKVLMGDTPAEEQMVETIYFWRSPDQIKKKACKDR